MPLKVMGPVPLGSEGSWLDVCLIAMVSSLDDQLALVFQAFLGGGGAGTGRIFDIVKWCGVADGELSNGKKAVRKMVEGGPCAKPKNRPLRYPRFEHPAVFQRKRSPCLAYSPDRG